MIWLRPAISCAVCLALSGGTVDALDVTPGNPVPPFTLVRIKLDPGERAWILGADLMPVDVEKTASGGLVFTAKPGRYAILAFTETSQEQRIVEIKDDGPPPPPPPANFGFEKFAFDNCQLIAVAGRRHVPKIAGNFTSTAAAIRRGDVLTLESSTAHIARQNAATLGSDVTAWNGWLMKIGYAVDRFEDEEKIKTVTHKAQVFEEIAAGLRKFAQQEGITTSIMRYPRVMVPITQSTCVSGDCVGVAP